MLVVWRVVMGLGTAVIIPETLSAITAAVPPEQRTMGGGHLVRIRRRRRDHRHARHAPHARHSTRRP
jgi:hypothetical protein